MISVIVPAYNLEKYITRTIESILAQTITDIEVIVVDDGSEDDTYNIICDFENRYPGKVRAIHINNSGVTTARITGIKYAKGDWIGFVDGDDYIEPNMYERLIENANKYNADISHCGYRMVFPDGRVNYFQNSKCIRKQDRVTGVKDLLAGNLIEPGLWNKIYKRELFDSILDKNVIDENIKINEDLLMNFILFSNSNNSIFEDFCPYHYIVRLTSASRQKLNENRIYDPIKVKTKIVELSDDQVKRDAEIAYMVTCINVYNTLITQKNKIYNTDMKKIKKIISDFSDIRILTKKYKCMCFAILYCTFLYKKVYNFYVKRFQKSRYI